MFDRFKVYPILARLILCSVLSCLSGATRADELNDLLSAFDRGMALQQKGDYIDAAKAFEKTVELAPRVFGPEHENTAVILNNMAELYRLMGQYAKAEPLNRQSHAIREAKFGPNHPEVAMSLHNMALLYGNMGQYAKAEPLYLRSLKIYEGQSGPDHPDVALLLVNLANLYMQMGQYAKAEPLSRKSLRIAESKFGPDHLSVATSLNNLATLYSDMGRYDKAEPLYVRSLRIREAKLEPDHPDLAQSFNNLASLYSDMGQYAKAESLSRRSLEAYEAKLGFDHPELVYCLANLASQYKKAGQYAKAEPVYQRSLKIAESKLGPNHRDVAMALTNLANLYQEMGQDAKAEPLLQRSLRIWESQFGPDHPDVARCLNSLANLYCDMGQYAKAEPLYQRSLKIDEAKLGTSHPDFAACLNNLAVLYRDMGRYAEAEQAYRRSLTIMESQLGPDHPDVAACLYNFATLYSRAGQYAEAERLYQSSLKIREARLAPDHPDVAMGLNGLAVLCWKRGQYAEAEPLYQRSLKIREAQLGPDHPHVAMNLNNLALLYADTERWPEAVAAVDKERRIIRRHVATTLPALSEKEQLAFLQTQDAMYLNNGLSIGLHTRADPASALRSAGWVLNGKAVAHEVLAQRALLAAEENDPTLGELARQVLATRRQLASLTMTYPKAGQEADYRRQLQTLSQQEQDQSRQLGRAAGGVTNGNPWVEPNAVRKSLAKDAVLIDMARFRVFAFKEKKWLPPHYVAWLIPSVDQGQVTIVDLGEAQPIDDAVQRTRKALEKAAQTIRAVGEAEAEKQLRDVMRSLAKLVFEPLESHFGQARQLIVSPDAALWLIPWGALPLADGKYAIEKYQIRYSVSGRDLVSRAVDPGQKITAPIMFANPDYDLGPKEADAATRAALRGTVSAERVAIRRGLDSINSLPRVGRLPGTAREAAVIKANLTRYANAEAVLYEDRNALEGIFKAAHGPRVLVLSTHGFFLPEQTAAHDDQRTDLAADSSRKDPIVRTTDGAPLENPLLRCGLLLAGCNRHGEENAPAEVDDGILTGLEIVGTDLRGTDLVVLSACQTGLGQIRNGEGVAGLRQAFQLAGANAVVSTLWQIPDAETVDLINAFFMNLSAGQTKAEALRNAQLTQIKVRRADESAAHPYYWAAFTLTGE